MATKQPAEDPVVTSWLPRIGRVAKAAAEISLTDELQGTLAVVSRELEPQTGRGDAARLYLADPTTRSLHLAHVGVGVEGLPGELTLDAAHFVARAAAARRPALDGSGVGLPLVFGQHVIGVLALIFADPEAAARADLESLQAVADVLALALGSSRAVTRTHQELSSHMERAAVANRAILDALEVVPQSQLYVALMRGFHLWPYAREQSVPEFLRCALRTIVEQACVAVDAQFGALGVVRNPDLPFDPWVFAGVSEQQVAAVGRHPRPIGTLGLVAMKGEPIRVRDVRTHPAFLGFPPHHPEVTSLLAIPLRYRDANVGNLYLGNKISAPEFTIEDQRIVEAMALHAGQALQIAYLRTAIEAQRAQLQSTLDSAPSGILFVDAVDEHVMANPRAMELLGKSIIPEAGLGQYLGFLCYPDGRPVPLDEMPMRTALRGETVRNVEGLICRGFRRIPVLISAAPVRTMENRILGAVVLFEDISALKELERARAEFGAVIAHDLRTPIQLIQLQVSALLGDVKNNQVRAPLAAVLRIQRAAAQLTQMTNDLLDATRTDLKHFSLERRSVAVDQLTSEIADQLRPAIVDHPIEVSAEVGLPRALLDPLRFHQIIVNLVDNAAKHSAQEAPISIHLAPSEGGVLVAVQDHGTGIPANELPMLFDRYYQASRSRAKKTGLGLGLYIVRGLVEAHGGRIWVESQVGEGTTFLLWLPAEPTRPAEGAGQAASPPV